MPLKLDPYTASDTCLDPAYVTDGFTLTICGSCLLPLLDPAIAVEHDTKHMLTKTIAVMRELWVRIAASETFVSGCFIGNFRVWVSTYISWTTLRIEFRRFTCPKT